MEGRRMWADVVGGQKKKIRHNLSWQTRRDKTIATAACWRNDAGGGSLLTTSPARCGRRPVNGAGGDIAYQTKAWDDASEWARQTGDDNVTTSRRDIFAALQNGVARQGNRYRASAARRRISRLCIPVALP